MYKKAGRRKPASNKYLSSEPFIFVLGSLILEFDRIFRNNQAFRVNIGQALFPHPFSPDIDSLKPESNEPKQVLMHQMITCFIYDPLKFPAMRGGYIVSYI
ncbi:MAG: hypothetical protein ACOH2V_14725 [Candidatus Saccharimonadaceae bacterium]